MRPSNFKWGHTHWAFTLVICLLILAFVCYYAHVNYDSENGNKFLSVAATLSSIILAVLAIFIAVAQIVMSEFQGSQFESHLGELRVAVEKIQPLPGSVTRLDDIVEEIKNARADLTNIPLRTKELLVENVAQMRASSSIKTPVMTAAQTMPAMISGLVYTTRGFCTGLGVICACHGKEMDREHILDKFVKPLLEETNHSLGVNFWNFMINGQVMLLSNFGLCKCPDPQTGKVEVHEGLRKEVLKSMTEYEHNFELGAGLFESKIIEMVQSSLDV